MTTISHLLNENRKCVPISTVRGSVYYRSHEESHDFSTARFLRYHSPFLCPVFAIITGVFCVLKTSISIIYRAPLCGWIGHPKIFLKRLYHNCLGCLLSCSTQKASPVASWKPEEGPTCTCKFPITLGLGLFAQTPLVGSINRT
jgi:hypothetical protein